MKRSVGVWIYLFVLSEINVTSSVTVNTFALGNEKPEKGSNIVMKCSYTVLNNNLVESLIVSKDGSSLAVCYVMYGRMASCTKYNGVPNNYMVNNSTITEIEFKITNVQISDGGNWRCGFQTDLGNALSLTLVVYATPASIVLDGSLQGGDLQSEDIKLTCKTSNCVFPSPQIFQWFYKRADPQWLLYKNSTPTTSQSTCKDREKIYSSTLSLARNTVWPLQPSNVETTVQFQCRLGFPTLQSPLESVQSGDVLYAVRVTSVTLKDGNEVPFSSDTIEVVIGSTKKLTCTTSTSRPVATIVWYIGTTVKQRGTNTIYMFSPTLEDNHKRIYCKAFNIQSEANSVSSNTPALDAKYKATVASFFIRGSEGLLNITVNETDNVPFVCTVESNPRSTIELQFQGKTLHRQDNTKLLTYNHDNVDCLDTGVYTCIAWNQYNYEQVSLNEIRLFIKCSPRPLHQVRWNFTSSLHVPVTLSFRALAYPEPGKKEGFLWYKENSFTWIPLLSNADLLISSSGLQSNLTIKNVSKADIGHYRVTVRNDIGKYEQYMFLIEEGSHNATENATKTCQLASVNTAWIISLGVLCAVLVVYAIFVTVLLKRQFICKEKPSQKSDKSNKQTTYANISYEPKASTSTERKDPQDRTDRIYEGDEHSLPQYTTLSRRSDDDRRTYDFIK